MNTSMLEASQRLAQSRRVLMEQMARRERRHDPRETPPRAEFAGEHFDSRARAPARGAGWIARARHAASVWWRHHPAHMAVEVATPLLAAYGRRKPAQLVGLCALAGAALMFARPWRLVSLTTVAFALLKSTHLPGIVMSALSAADFERDHAGPE
ncbi:MAG TPA: hypothetical protein VHA82_01555 [Ramlibacter sp.]|uniref:hypothetical protein n=1 Tax=Ramlibacter sp. TaxID=1917967 RepID=UPI002CF57998|nr:hypothetical protein [Ramlibacter sp.]HVZ42467.1 hypothetical protein [Ramlibacter sp.]